MSEFQADGEIDHEEIPDFVADSKKLDECGIDRVPQETDEVKESENGLAEFTEGKVFAKAKGEPCPPQEPRSSCVWTHSKRH